MEDKEVEYKWRKLLWYHHGCDIMCLYGDDGEMQCNYRGHTYKSLPTFPDFKRDSIELLEWKLASELFREITPKSD